MLGRPANHSAARLTASPPDHQRTGASYGAVQCRMLYNVSKKSLFVLAIQTTAHHLCAAGSRAHVAAQAS
jgi:hypothetical protein